MSFVKIPLALTGPIVHVELSVPREYAPWGGPSGRFDVDILIGMDVLLKVEIAWHGSLGLAVLTL